MRQFVSLMVVSLLMVPAVQAEEKPTRPSFVAVLHLTPQEHHVVWTIDVGDQPTGFRVYGKTGGQEHLLDTLPGWARNYATPILYEEYSVSALVGAEESGRIKACVTVRAGPPPEVIGGEDCPIPSVP